VASLYGWPVVASMPLVSNLGRERFCFAICMIGVKDWAPIMHDLNAASCYKSPEIFIKPENWKLFQPFCLQLWTLGENNISLGLLLTSSLEMGLANSPSPNLTNPARFHLHKLSKGLSLSLPAPLLSKSVPLVVEYAGRSRSNHCSAIIGWLKHTLLKPHASSQ